MKRFALSVLTQPVLAPLLDRFTRSAAPILMLHRFADHEAGNAGHDVAALRANLAFLRRRRFEVLPLSDVVARLATGEPPLFKTVAFTVDDGYADFARIAADAFAEFDCPVTVFVVTGFLDGHGTLWWDRIEIALARTRRSAAVLDLPTGPVRYAWSDALERDRVRTDLVERLKRVDDAAREAALARLAAELEVDLPATPPPAYGPMTWDDARRCARRGVTFGPHTVTHPILSRVDDRRAAGEIRDSWRRVREELPGSVPIFCYPNGDPDSFGAREQAILGESGFAAAVTTVQEYATPEAFAADGAAGRFKVPRFPYFDDAPAFRQVVGGLERAKRALRGRGR